MDGKRQTSLFNSFCRFLLRVLLQLKDMQLHENKVEALEHCVVSFFNLSGDNEE